MTMVVNSLFTRDAAGVLQMTTNAPIFAEVRRRTESNTHGEFREGVYIVHLAVSHVHLITLP